MLRFVSLLLVTIATSTSLECYDCQTQLFEGYKTFYTIDVSEPVRVHGCPTRACAAVPGGACVKVSYSKGEEDWEIYAWCVRDSIAKAGDFKKVEFYNFQDRRNFYHFMNFRLDEIVIGDGSFSYDSRHASDGYEKVV